MKNINIQKLDLLIEKHEKERGYKPPCIYMSPKTRRELIIDGAFNEEKRFPGCTRIFMSPKDGMYVTYQKIRVHVRELMKEGTFILTDNEIVD